MIYISMLKLFVSLKNVVGHRFVIPDDFDEIRTVRFHPDSKKTKEAYSIKLRLWACIRKLI